MQNILFKKRVLFVGMPDMALVCLDKLYNAGINIVGIVPPPVGDPSYEYFLSYTSMYNLPVFSYEKSLKDKNFIERIKKLNADIAVVCSYNRLFPQEFLECTKDGFINCHPSLLPDYRGANPYSACIINKENETGVTFHFMDKTFDTGDIILQKTISLKGTETMGILFNLTNLIAAEGLLLLLTEYEKNNQLPRTPQIINSDKKAPKILSDNIQNAINWSLTAEQIETFVRALNPFILAASYFRNEHITIMSVSYSDTKTFEDPGTVCNTDNCLGVATGSGIVYLEALQFGTYVVCSGKELVERINIKNGEKFT